MTDPSALTRRVVGFLEEAPGVRSSTRLFGAILLALAAVLVAVIVWYVWWCATRTPIRDPSSTVIGALVGGLTAVVAQGVVAISKRTKTGAPDDPT